ncbi:MAG TPA: hypothetical protein VG326_04115 [Tepidisphaeraceae bacterium]|nr:hypothetical protein [Tepidisphaeraceae bacterium]
MAAKDFKASAADLKKLNDVKDRLSPDLQDALKKAWLEFDTAKAASSLKIPGFSGDSNK